MTDEIKTAAQRVEKWLHYQGAGSPHAMSLRHDDLRTLISAASARGVAEGWKESLCYDQAGGTGQFELNDPEPDNHHSALYLQDPNGALFNISCDNREGLDIKRGQWMVAVLNAALSAAPSSPAATPEVEREDQIHGASDLSEQALADCQIDFLEERADEWMADTGVQRMFNAIASVFEKHAPQEIMDRFREKLGVIGRQCHVEGALRLWEEIAQQQRAMGRPLPADQTEAACLLALRTPPAPAGELTTIFENAFPDGTRDRSTYSDIEDALDLADAPSMDGTRWLHLPERIAALTTTGFIAGRDAAAGVAANLVECDRDCGFRELADRGDMIVAAIRAIEAPRESGRAAATSYPHGAALTPDAQVIGAGDNVAPVAAGVERFCRQNGGNAGEGGNG